MTALIFAIATLVIGAGIGAAITWHYCRQLDTSHAYRSGYDLGYIDGQLETAARMDSAMHRVSGEGP